MNQNMQCSRCHSKALTVNDFGKDKYENYFKTCNMCREDSNQRKANNRDTIRQYCKQHYQANKEHKLEQVKRYNEANIERLTEKVLCGCGGKFQYRTKAEHERTNKHLKYLNRLSSDNTQPNF